MQRRHPGTTRIECHQHVECLRPTDLSNDDPVGTLSQGLSYEIAQCDLGASVEAGVASLHLRHIWKISIDLKDLLARHHSPIRWHFTEQTVDKGRLSGPGCSGDEYREIVPHGVAEKGGRWRSERSSFDQFVESGGGDDEFANLDVEAIRMGDRRARDVDPGSVGELCRHDR